MFVLKSNICIGYSNNRIILNDFTNELPTKYLSLKSSFILISMINLDTEFKRYKFLVDNNIAKNILEAKNLITKFAYSIKSYLHILEDNFPIDASKVKKINIERFLKSSPTINSDEYRLNFPNQIVWVPTWKCNRSCLYCGVAKINPNIKENRLPLEKVYKMLNELIENEVASINIHGGDPLFCYGDEIFDIIFYLTSNGITNILISTKNHISVSMAQRLKKVGLKELQLSLDSTDDGLLKTLYGESNFIDNFQNSVRNLQDASIIINVNIVVSSLNYKDIPNLLLYLNSLVINKVSLSPYRRGPINQNDYSLTSSQQHWLTNELKKIENSFTFDKFVGALSNDTKLKSLDRPICAAGRSSILILPDGRCCYCDYLSENQNFIFGSLSDYSLKEIWNSDKLDKLLHPNINNFEGTKCFTCNEFLNCVKKGICFLKTDPKKIFSPDHICIECE